jgi:integrase
VARQSKNEYVKKICGCVKWKDCAHPWYVDYRQGEGKGGRVLRKKLSPLVGREPTDFIDAKAEARRAIVAWKDGRNAADLLPMDRPTLASLLDSYRQRPDASPSEKYQVRPIVDAVVSGRPFGEWHADEITREMIETFRAKRKRIAGNRNLALLRAMFNWAVLGGLVPSTPFKVGTVSAVKLVREEARTRRLEPGEDVQLLIHAGRLKDLITAALETGCRQGELLSLQWRQVLAHDLFLPAGKTKAKKTRRVRISSELRKVLDARRNDPAGNPLPGHAYVFGDAVGRRAKNIREAWAKTVLKAHGIVPVTDRKTGRLTAACVAQFKSIDLPSMICDGKRARAGWMPVWRCRRFRSGLATPTSARPARISQRPAVAMRMRWSDTSGRLDDCRKLPYLPNPRVINRPQPTNQLLKRLRKTSPYTNEQGSGIDWGSRDRRFESARPDHFSLP